MKTKGEQTKQRILETAATMFWKSSYHKVRVDKIVEKAEVNKASFYQYFKNKEQAAVESIAYMHKLTKEMIFEAAFESDDDPIKRLESIFNNIFQIHKEQLEDDGICPGCPFVNMGNEMAVDSEVIRQKIEIIFSDFHSYHESIYRDAVKQGLIKSQMNSKVIARQLQGILNGGMVSSKLRNCPEDILEALVSAKTILGLKSHH